MRDDIDFVTKLAAAKVLVPDDDLDAFNVDCPGLVNLA